MNDLLSIQTPAYVYDLEELQSNLSAFKMAVESNWERGPVIMGLSVKTAPIAAIIQFANKLGYFAEVVSDEEYDFAKMAECKADQIIFNGPIKSKAKLWKAFADKSIVNIDSWREIRYAAQYAKETGIIPEVGLRINFDLERRCPGETLSGALPPRFGFSYEDGSLSKAVEELRESGIEPAGIHAHFSSVSHSVGVFGAIGDAVVEIADRLHLRNLSYVDIGGGFYGGGNNTKVYSKYAEHISEHLSELDSRERLALILEPGGSVLATAGSLVGRVIDHKTVRGEHVVVSELSRLNLNSTVFEKKKNQVTAVHLSEGDTLPKQAVCGYTCMEMDRIGYMYDEPYLVEGDLVMVSNVGAYGVSFSPGFFIKNPPSLYLKSPSGFDLVVDSRQNTPPYR